MKSYKDLDITLCMNMLTFKWKVQVRTRFGKIEIKSIGISLLTFQFYWIFWRINRIMY